MPLSYSKMEIIFFGDVGRYCLGSFAKLLNLYRWVRRIHVEFELTESKCLSFTVAPRTKGACYYHCSSIRLSELLVLYYVDVVIDARLCHHHQVHFGKPAPLYSDGYSMRKIS